MPGQTATDELIYIAIDGVASVRGRVVINFERETQPETVDVNFVTLNFLKLTAADTSVIVTNGDAVSDTQTLSPKPDELNLKDAGL